MKSVTDDQRSCCSVRCPQRILESAETAEHTSDAVNSNNFASVRPVVCIRDQPSTHRILPNIIPFRGIALIAAQQMIEGSWLPERGQLLTGNASWLLPFSRQCRIEIPLQTLDPVAQAHSATEPKPDKQMNVIRHDHVATDADRRLRRLLAVVDKCRVYFNGHENPLPLVGVECDEVERRIETLENQVESRRLLFEHALHSSVFSFWQWRRASTQRPCCSVRCPQRIWKSAETADATASEKSAEDSGRYSTLDS